MGRKRSKQKDSNTNNNKNSTDKINFSAEEIEALNLLDIQLNAQLVGIVSDLLSYEATIEGIKLVYSKHNGESMTAYKQDVLAIQSVYLGIFTKLIFTQIGLTRYEHLYEKYMNGELDYSLAPNEDVNTANLIGLITSYYSLRAALAFYERDSNQPIFGI